MLAYAAEATEFKLLLAQYISEILQLTLSKLMNQHKVNMYQTSDAILCSDQLKGWDTSDWRSLIRKMHSLKRLLDSQNGVTLREL